MDREKLKTLLKQHEGVRKYAYRDIIGKVTIGVGRNLDDRGLRPSEIEFLLNNDVDEVEQEIATNFPWFSTLSDARQLVIADMLFNLGMTRLLEFKLMLRAVERGDYAEAAAQMLASRWARQVGQRSKDLAQMMRAG